MGEILARCDVTRNLLAFSPELLHDAQSMVGVIHVWGADPGAPRDRLAKLQAAIAQITLFGGCDRSHFPVESNGELS